MNITINTDILKVECPICKFRRNLTEDEKTKYRLDSKSYDFIAPWCSVEHKIVLFDSYRDACKLKTQKTETSDNWKIIQLQAENSVLRKGVEKMNDIILKLEIIK